MRFSKSFICTRCNCGCGILEKSLKRPMMVFRFAISARSVVVLSWKISSNSEGAQIARPQQVFHGDLEREQRILQLVRQAAG